jgi:hypothetical protein
MYVEGMRRHASRLRRRFKFAQVSVETRIGDTEPLGTILNSSVGRKECRAGGPGIKRSLHGSK